MNNSITKTERQLMDAEIKRLNDIFCQQVLDNRTIDKCNASQKKMVMHYAFGGEFMASNDKGSKKTYIN